MKKVLLTALIAFSAEQSFAICNSKKDMKGTWDYYQAVAFASSKSNISNGALKNQVQHPDRVWCCDGKTLRTIET
jgi:hypothetical protein